MDPYDYPIAYAVPSVPPYGYYYYLVEAAVPVPIKQAKKTRDLSVQELLFGCFRSPSYVYEDAISETNPRVIDDARARKLAADLKKCTYYETCATYGLNVEKVFQDACQKIVQQRMMTLGTIPRSATPNHFASTRSAIWGPGHPQPMVGPPHHQQGPYLSSPTHHGATGSGPGGMMMSPHPGAPYGPPAPPGTPSYHGMPPPSGPFPSFLKEKSGGKALHPGEQMLSRVASSGGALFGTGALRYGAHHQNLSGGENSSGGEKSGKNNMVDDRRMMPPPSADGRDQFPTPSSTPTTSRKSRRRSNLFTPSSSKKEEAEKKAKNGELGVGRAIPLKQGLLYKRSSKALNKDWKKKYVTLCDHGRLTYHPSLQDYMEDVHGKEIDLQCTTVKYAGQHRPRVPATNGMLDMSQLSLSDRTNCDTDTSFVISSNGVANGGADSSSQQQQSTAMGPPPPQQQSSTGTGTGTGTGTPGPAPPSSSSSSSLLLLGSSSQNKKRHRRLKTSISRSKHNHHHGGGGDDGDDSDGYEFFIVSKDSKTWHFEAANAEERDEWVQAIEQCILASLQGNESFKGKNAGTSGATKVNMDPSAIMALRKAVEGNQNCCDCDAPNPDWASLNLGTLICIECSGIHRNLGSHISRVRSLGLDEWPPGPLAVMMALGNRVANSVWEGGLVGNNKYQQTRAPAGSPVKPGPTTAREEKERWVRWKYEEKRFLAPLSNPGAIGQHLIDAVCRGDVKHVSLLLAHAKPEHVTVTVSSRDLRTPLHIACSMGNLPIVQLLLWNQAPVMPRDHDGMTCLDHARLSGNSNVEELIVQYCATNANAAPTTPASAAVSVSSSSSSGAGPQHSPSATSLMVNMNGSAFGSPTNVASSSATALSGGSGLVITTPSGVGRNGFPVGRPGGSLVLRCQDGSKGPNGLDPFEKMPSSVI